MRRIPRLARARTAGSPLRRRYFRPFAFAVAVAVVLTGCYTLEPVRGGIVPAVGSQVAFDVNDQGRVALGGTMGPSILQVEGRLLSKDSSNYSIAVSEIHFLQGGDQVWAGERVNIGTQYVTSVYERRFSAVRTAVAGGAVVGALAAIVGRSLLGSGEPDQPTTPPDTFAAVRRPRRP